MGASWAVLFAVATTIEAYGQARPFWLIVGALLTGANCYRAGGTR